MSNEIKQTKLGFLFNTATVEPSEYDNSPVPEGNYTVTIDSAEVKETKSGTGAYANIAFKLNNGRFVFIIFNLTNENEDAVRIGRQQLKNLLDALNITTIDDLKVIIGKSLDVKVTIKNDNKGEPRNNITKYAPMGTLQTSLSNVRPRIPSPVSRVTPKANSLNI